MIKAFGEYETVINDMINNKHLGRLCRGNAIDYLHNKGYPTVPFFKMRIVCPHDKAIHGKYDIIRRIEYNIVDECDAYGQFSKLDYNIIDNAFIQYLYEYFVSIGYPIDGKEIACNERIAKFVKALGDDGIDIGRYFSETE